MNWITALEWLAFGGSLASVWLYGRSAVYGPLAGVFVALLFIAFGLTAGVYAAAVSNVVFFVLHLRNYIDGRQNDMTRIKKKIAEGFSFIQEQAHKAAVEAGWWHDLESGELKPINVGEKLCLIHSEISEAMEGDRKNLMDDKLPHRSMIEVELADAVIRIGDLAGRLGLDVGGAIAEKMEFNAQRPDHKVENRKGGHGKKY